MQVWDGKTVCSVDYRVMASLFLFFFCAHFDAIIHVDVGAHLL